MRKASGSSILSGSNMSGKSTFLRTIGLNVVLAHAGAPVPAGTLRLTPLLLGASIRTVDSLQEGASRFYAELQRLKAIVDLSLEERKLLFLLDELLSGTNSHDRKIGAEGIVETLLRRGSIGPPIMVRLSGVGSPRAAISDTAASTGTVGWQTEITCTSGPMKRMNSCT